MKKTFEWYLGDIVGHITGFFFNISWKIPVMFDFSVVNCFEGFSDGFVEEES